MPDDRPKSSFPSQSAGRSMPPWPTTHNARTPDRRGRGREGGKPSQKRGREESRPKHFARLPPPSSHRSGDGCLPGESSAQFLGSTAQFGRGIASLGSVSMHKREWRVAIAGVCHMTGEPPSTRFMIAKDIHEKVRCFKSLFCKVQVRPRNCPVGFLLSSNVRPTALEEASFCRISSVQTHCRRVREDGAPSSLFRFWRGKSIFLGEPPLFKY